MFTCSFQEQLFFVHSLMSNQITLIGRKYIKNALEEERDHKDKLEKSDSNSLYKSNNKTKYAFLIEVVLVVNIYKQYIPRKTHPGKTETKSEINKCLIPRSSSAIKSQNNKHREGVIKQIEQRILPAGVAFPK